jgi:signal transduction histidine kinase
MEPWLENFARANFRRSADTAHDLKTPLNVAVLNLELLRMRVRRIVEGDDEKVLEYTRAIDAELRRMGAIFDAFFILSTPPRQDETPATVDLAKIAVEEAEAYGFELGSREPATIQAHESRIRQAYKLFFESATKFLRTDERVATSSTSEARHVISTYGQFAGDPVELSKVFKFYYSDAEGRPDLSLAVARLIAETYGGELRAVEERDNVILELSFPLGAR